MHNCIKKNNKKKFCLYGTLNWTPTTIAHPWHHACWLHYNFVLLCTYFSTSTVIPAVAYFTVQSLLLFWGDQPSSTRCTAVLICWSIQFLNLLKIQLLLQVHHRFFLPFGYPLSPSSSSAKRFFVGVLAILSPTPSPYPSTHSRYVQIQLFHQ